MLIVPCSVPIWICIVSVVLKRKKIIKHKKNQVHCRSNPLSFLDTKARLMHYNCNALIVFLYYYLSLFYFIKQIKIQRNNTYVAD